MGKKLAIKGHATRGKEIIELLEMMGGKNDEGYSGTNTWKDEYYFLDNGYIRAYDWCDGIKFTLEEFLMEYPFKVNDKVIDKADGCPGVVCEMKWDEDVSDMKYCVVFENGIEFVDFAWYAKDSIEFCKENKNLEENKFPPFEPMFKMNDELEYMVPDGYEITEASKDKVFIKLIKPKYPKTIGDCCKVILDIGDYQMCGYKHELLFNFQNLLICCGAYCKIAGEEMGLGKPWEPDWSTKNERKYVIEVYCNNVRKNSQGYSNTLLAFPTEEMRDAFAENFKDLIEQCKELL